MLCVCPGSYDPVTVGHIDIIRRAARLTDQVIVAVVHNPGKEGTFSIEERVDLLSESLADVDNVRLDELSNGLLTDFCRDVGADAVVKGLRSGTDFSYELPMALMNRHLTGLETIFIPGDPRYEHVSSSLVKEVARFGGDVSGLVPGPVLDPLLHRLRSL
ncbi:pantetheine-phosphate adenylyltransferase [Spelaeicoccus albus]|uniref:Phosphopantetheine adenylyltransferase n=1 Tax=Spelaeicoccus albus TaxID=1280376 RepID=A0A7Z0IHF7_9MICO|nr:pantetheine-phosphate adenylyltransferase [Spelaeicoccus albus]NYI67728.1 pantetheine-phosphate adenylyltransferase [Spelaeicoccus albus]